MPKHTSFVKQAAILAAASLLVRFIGFLYRLPITHFIGDAGNAYYAAAFTVFTLFLIITSGALPAAISKLVAERIAVGQYRNAHEMFKTAMGFALVVGLFFGVGMFFGADMLAGGFAIGYFRFFNYPQAAMAIRVFAPALAVIGVLAVFRGYFQGMKNMMPTAVSQVVEQIFKFIFAVWLAWLFVDAAHLDYSVAGAAAGTGIGAIAAVLVCALLYWVVRKDLLKRAREDVTHAYYETKTQQVMSLVRIAFPIIISMSIYHIANFIDLGMATDRIAASGAFTPDEVDALVGQFTGKFILLTTLPASVSIALSAAVLPEISQSKAMLDHDAIRKKGDTALRISMMLTIPAATGLAVLADPILALLFPSHPEGGWLLQWGTVSIIFLAFTQIISGVLQGIGKPGIPVIAAFFGVMVKIPLNHYLMAIPEINILGAVISTIACYLVAAIINMFFLYRHTKIVPDFIGAIVKPLIASIGMGLASYLVYYAVKMVTPRWFSTVLALGVGVMVYLMFMLMIRGFSHVDLNKLPLPKFMKKIIVKFH